MNRTAAFECLKQGEYITHPKLEEANAGPLCNSNGTICDKLGIPISEWKIHIDSEIFNDGWFVCNENGEPIIN